MSIVYTDKHIKYIKQLKEEDLTWQEITRQFNEEFDCDISENAIRKTHKRHSEIDVDGEVSDDTVLIKNLKTSYSARKLKNKIQKENKALLEHSTTLDEFLAEFTKCIKLFDTKKVVIDKPAKNKNKTKMIVEPMLSDIHFGLETETYNADVAQKRVQAYTKTVLKEIDRKAVNYDIQSIHIPLLGDFMQSDSMHGKESAKSCHLTNAEQILKSIEVIFYDFILPIAQKGYSLMISGVCGNHDRSDEKQFIVSPGKSYFNYTIYKMLEILCREKGIKDVTFNIPNGIYHVQQLFNSYFLYEHGHTVKGSSIPALESELIKRQGQCGKIISGIRIGHYHSDLSANEGRHIINASSVSDDHYGDYLGYKSRPGQVINFYVDSDRESSYYHSFTVDLNLGA